MYVPPSLPPTTSKPHKTTNKETTHQDQHWTSHTDFVAGKLYRSAAEATTDLDKLLLPPSPSPSPSTNPNPNPIARPTSSARSVSTSSDSSLGSNSDGLSVKFEVRKIAARPLCGSYTWWFVDELEQAVGAAS